MDDITELVPPTTIDVQKMDSELSRLVREAAGENIHALSRTSTLNLVGYAPSQDAVGTLSDMIRAQSLRHPNRTIIISAGDNGAEAKPDVKARIDAQVSGPDHTRVVFEEVDIASSGSDQMVSLVLTLLLPDLPVVLVWYGEAPFENALFSQLEKLADRILIDTATFASPRQDLVKLAHMLDERYDISDLNWSRLTPWRELTAQFFDTKALQTHLRRLDRVVMRYEANNGRPTNLPQALLLAGWLTAQLGWTPMEGGFSVEGELIRIHLRRPAFGIGSGAIRLVTIELQAAPVVDDSLDSIASLSLQATDNVLATFSVQRAEDPNCANTSVDVAGMTPMSRTVRLEQLSSADLISQELRLLSTDATYSAALRMAARFAQQLV